MTKNSVFCDSFNQCIRLMISEIESNSTNMKPDPEERLNLVGVFALMTLHNKMFPNMDRKLVNKILELCKKVCTSLKIKSYCDTKLVDGIMNLEHLSFEGFLE